MVDIINPLWRFPTPFWRHNLCLILHCRFPFLCKFGGKYQSCLMFESYLAIDCIFTGFCFLSIIILIFLCCFDVGKCTLILYNKLQECYFIVFVFLSVLLFVVVVDIWVLGVFSLCLFFSSSNKISPRAFKTHTQWTQTLWGRISHTAWLALLVFLSSFSTFSLFRCIKLICIASLMCKFISFVRIHKELLRGRQISKLPEVRTHDMTVYSHP